MNACDRARADLLALRDVLLDELPPGSAVTTTLLAASVYRVVVERPDTGEAS